MDTKPFRRGTLVPGCGWHTRSDGQAEIIRRASEHLRETHGETVIRENIPETVKVRIEQNNTAA